MGQGPGGGQFPSDEAGDGAGGGSQGGDVAGDAGDGSEIAGEGTADAGDPFGEGRGGAGGDEEFDDSLGEFDREMSREQEEVALEGGGVAADSAVAGEDESAGKGGEEGGPGKTTGSAPGNESPGVEVKDLGPDPVMVATVEGCDDRDRVARQLCEAATKENDPFLRAALWGEYNEYKKLANQ